jgi:hypothetical protein
VVSEKYRGGGEWTIPSHALKGQPPRGGARRDRRESRARELEKWTANSGEGRGTEYVSDRVQVGI